MERREQPLMTIEAELRVPVATLQLVHYQFLEAVTGDLREAEDYRLDLCLTPRPRNARACYPDRWASHRFERLGSVWLLPPGETLQACSDGGRRQRSLVCQKLSEPLGCVDVLMNAGTSSAPAATVRLPLVMVILSQLTPPPAVVLLANSQK